MTDELLKMEDVSFSYPNGEDVQRDAVSQLTFSLERGSFTAVIGHNGSGKSTMAKLCNGLLTADSGTVRVCGYDPAREEEVWEVRRRCGLVLQNPDNQLVTTVVEEDVAFGPENLGLEPAEIRRRVDAALAAVDMTAYALKAPHLLSGGQKQRIAIAGILAMEPELLVFDESTAMLDPKGRKEVLATVRRLQKERGITVLWITHYMEEAVDADRILVMDGGRLVMDGTPLTVFPRAQELSSMGLTVPIPVQIAMGLKERGVDLQEIPTHMETLAEAICRYSYKK